jgi:ABC-type cobalamin/Fe3+-siderophores transport system ATPase subunit
MNFFGQNGFGKATLISAFNGLNSWDNRFVSRKRNFNFVVKYRQLTTTDPVIKVTKLRSARLIGTLILTFITRKKCEKRKIKSKFLSPNLKNLITRNLLEISRNILL